MNTKMNPCMHPDCEEVATHNIIRLSDGGIEFKYCCRHTGIFMSNDVLHEFNDVVINNQTVKEEVKRMTKIGSFLRSLGDKADILQPKAEKAAIKVGKGLKEAGRKVAVVSLKGSLKVTTEISNLLTKIQPKPKTETLDDSDNAQDEHEHKWDVMEDGDWTCSICGASKHETDNAQE